MNGITSTTLTKEQRDWIVQYDEGHLGDVKGINIRPAKMSETVSAFANAEGGELWIGVDEDDRKRRSWRGFRRIEDANAHIEVLDAVMQLGQGYYCEFLDHPASIGFVLHIVVSKTPNIIRATNEAVFIRRGAHNQPVNEVMLRQLERNKGIVSFETETLNADPRLITSSVAINTFMHNIVPSARADEWLKKQQVIIGGKPTVGGVVLFADEPQAILPKRCGIKIARYTTTVEGEGTRETLSGNPISIEGCAYQLIHSAVRRTQEIIEGVRKWTEQGAEMVAYPPETLHEIITNAVLHRDYSIPDDISVRIFDNRVEVESPGTLPGHITERNILRERFARNPAIVRLINKFPNPPNKDIGEGLRTAFDAMTRMRLRPPEIRQSEQSVIFYIRHTRIESAEDAVMDYLRAHPQITNSIGRELTGIRSENTMKQVFVRLANRHLIERVPNARGRSSAWQRTLEPETERELERQPTQPPLWGDGVSSV